MREAIVRWLLGGASFFTLAVLAPLAACAPGGSNTPAKTPAAGAASSVAVSSTPSVAATQSPNDIAIECRTFVVGLEDVQTAFGGHVVTQAVYGTDKSMAGEPQKTCLYSTAVVHVDPTRVEERRVQVSVLQNGQKTWKQLLGVITPHQKLPIGDEAIATVKGSTPYVAVRKGNKVLTVVFGEGSDTPVSHEQARTLAGLAIQRL